MKTSVEKLEPTKVKLTVTADVADLKEYLDDARKHIGEQVNVPGFRKGHVPAKVIDKRFGFGSVMGQAMDAAVTELYAKAAEAETLRPMDQPKFDVVAVPESAEDEKGLEFTAEVEVRPEITLPEFKGLEISVPNAEANEEDINNRLEAMRKRFSSLVSVDKPAAKGDFANISLVAKIDGDEVDSQDGLSYELGSGSMLDGLDEALEGLSTGESTTFESTLLAGEHEGEKAQVTVTVNSVKAEELPELDDEFAQEASEFETLEELKADLAKSGEFDARARQATQARDAFMDKLQEGLEIPVPAGIKENLVNEHLKTVTKGNVADATDEQKKDAEEAAIKDLQAQIILDTLAEVLDIDVTQAEVTDFLASIAAQYGMDPSRFISGIIQNGQLGTAVREVGRTKGMRTAMSQAVFKDADGNVVDLSEFLNMGDEDKEEEASVAAANAAAKVADELASEE